MRSKFALIALGCCALAGCNTPDVPDRGIAAVNVPVVTSADYVFDAPTANAALAPGQRERLDGWFQGLGLGYGDTIYLDGADADIARGEVAEIAGRYGMPVSAGAPVTPGEVAPNAVRVVVARRRAEVPNCPNWNVQSQPNYENRTMSNFGCGVNGNLAAQIANPEDLIHGREGSGLGDTATASKAVQFYRAAPPTGANGLQQINTEKKGTQ